MARTGHADVVGQMKAALECAGGDATVQVVALCLVCGFTARHEQRAVLDFDGEFFIGKTGHGNRDTPCVISGFFNVVWGIGVLANIAGKCAIHQIGDLVKANGGAVKWCQIKCTHLGHPFSKR